MVGMKVGGVRRLIVPQELGYPGQPPDFTKQGPTPGNFSVSEVCLSYLLVILCEQIGGKAGLHSWSQEPGCNGSIPCVCCPVVCELLRYCASMPTMFIVLVSHQNLV